jgi:hypothetical protein
MRRGLTPLARIFGHTPSSDHPNTPEPVLESAEINPLPAIVWPVPEVEEQVRVCDEVVGSADNEEAAMST